MMIQVHIWGILTHALVYLVQQPELCWTALCTQHHIPFLPAFPPCFTLMGILQVPQLTQESSYKCQDGRHNLQDCILQDWPKGPQGIWVRVFITSSRLGIHDSTWTTTWHSFEELRLNHCMSVQTNLLAIPKGIKKLRNTQTSAQEEWSEVRK